MNRLIGVLFLAAAAGVFYFAPRGSGPEVKASRARLTDLRRTPASFNFQTMGPVDRQRVSVAVIYFCLDKYQRDSCLHHLITCGESCKKLITPNRWEFLRREFAAAKRERGL